MQLHERDAAAASGGDSGAGRISNFTELDSARNGVDGDEEMLQRAITASMIEAVADRGRLVHGTTLKLLGRCCVPKDITAQFD
jgi:hypothetical protein